MHASTALAGLVALVGTASAVPAGPDAADVAIRQDLGITLGPRDGQAADATMPWVSVNDEGQPQETYSPSLTTESGTTGVHDAAPHDLTASVYTWTSYAMVTTSTGEPPNPTAAHKNGQGAFSRCYNVDGDYAPFCRPSHNTTLYTGNVYYVTWDPDFYNTTGDNTTYEIAVRVNYLNKTTNEWLKLDTYDRVPAAWGFWPFKVESKHLKGHKTLNNVTLSLLQSAKGSSEIKNTSVELPAAIGKPTLPAPKPTPKPSNKDLVIALPVTLGTVALLILGVCLWNRKTRRIHLPKALHRGGRQGYTGRSTRRIFHKDNGIQLVEREPPVPDYSDDFLPPHAPRRDSDSLGSLAGSPVEPTFQSQNATGGRNAFRDEVERQNQQRREDERFI